MDIANAAETAAVYNIIKQEPLDVDYPETYVTVNKVQLDLGVVEPEVGRASSYGARSRDSVEAPEFPAAIDCTVKQEPAGQVQPELPQAQVNFSTNTINADVSHTLAHNIAAFSDSDTALTLEPTSEEYSKHGKGLDRARTHLDTEHKRTKRHSCNYCNYQCSYKNSLEKHIRTHTGEKPYSCTHCDYTCTHAQRLKTHMMTHTGEKPYSCKQCDYKCAQFCNLKSHMKTHTGEKPNACEHCDYKCTHPRDMKVHIRTHTGEKPFLCKLCDYKCTYARGLKKHMMIHTGEKPYSCKHCDLKFTHACNLKRHNMIQHSSEIPYSCTHCDYKCTQPSKLKTHLKTHVAEKLHSCEHCDYKCPRSGSLKIHMVTHTGDKPYSCTHCDYKCSQASNLKRHVKTHTGEKPSSKHCDYKNVTMRKKLKETMSQPELEYEFVACKMENMEAADSKPEQEKLFKQEALETDANVCDMQLKEIKHELADASELSRG